MPKWKFRKRHRVVRPDVELRIHIFGGANCKGPEVEIIIDRLRKQLEADMAALFPVPKTPCGCKNADRI